MKNLVKNLLALLIVVASVAAASAQNNPKKTEGQVEKTDTKATIKPRTEINFFIL